jgi:hypothetical protein
MFQQRLEELVNLKHPWSSWMVPQSVAYEEFAGSGVWEGNLKGRPL